MSSRRMRGLDPKLEAVRDQFERWRRTRKKHSPIPEALWDGAARVAAEFGVGAVAQALRLNHTDLKKRVEAAPHNPVQGVKRPWADKKQGKRGPALDGAHALARRVEAAVAPKPSATMLAPTFVEVDLGPSLAPAPCVVEMEHPGGVKMKISLRGLGGADLAALVQAFGSRPG